MGQKYSTNLVKFVFARGLTSQTFRKKHVAQLVLTRTSVAYVHVQNYYFAWSTKKKNQFLPTFNSIT